MSGILFLAHRLPFPPDRGDKIRSHHLLKALAQLAPVHVGCLAETSADRAHEAELANVAASWCMPQRSKPLIQAGIEAVLRREPVSLAAFRNHALHEWVSETLATHDIDTIYVFSGQMGQYIPHNWQGRLIVDLVDVDSAKFDALAQTGCWPKSWINRREGLLLRVEEARLAKLADHTVLVSEAEAALLRSRLPTSSGTRVSALGNGIDTANFDPGAIAVHPELSGGSGPHLVFTGQMDYAPNVDAALHVIRDILPQIRAVHPTAMFHVVGRAPVPLLTSHDGENGCRIWGEVPDTRPFLAAADIVLAPLRIARGVQNKVLEAMAMARPVLLTSDAATGIPARSGEHFVAADGAEALVRQALILLEDRGSADGIGDSARRFVMDRMSWSAALAELPALIGRCPTGSGHRDAA